MKVIYYKIVEYNPHTCIKGSIILEGIAKNIHTIIYPRIDSNIDELPYESTLEEFSHENFIIEYWEIELTRQLVENLKK